MTDTTDTRGQTEQGRAALADIVEGLDGVTPGPWDAPEHESWPQACAEDDERWNERLVKAKDAPDGWHSIAAVRPGCEEAVEAGLADTMKRARDIVGDDDTYVTFDIDCLDPAFAPGTGTPEAGGFTTREAQFMLRQMRGLKIIGADVVEVSPPFDASGYTALAGVTMMFELLCIMAERV